MSEARYRIDLAPAAQRQLRRLPPGDAASSRAPILALAMDARPPGSTKLVGSEFWRLRVGDLRVIYAIDDAASMVIVVRVARRAESSYRNLPGTPRDRST
ncbi:MAG: type II toxin-antitoxin system RelE/ParE family toxin [Chloroflexi bacterium]|nr:type II toxin-antitoxin system RelE/ParE family toxin [Chloroflexota bacterium]